MLIKKREKHFYIQDKKVFRHPANRSAIQSHFLNVTLLLL